MSTASMATAEASLELASPCTHMPLTNRQSLDGIDVVHYRKGSADASSKRLCQKHHRCLHQERGCPKRTRQTRRSPSSESGDRAGDLYTSNSGVCSQKMRCLGPIGTLLGTRYHIACRLRAIHKTARRCYGL